jgi:hypothetical protein
MFGFFKLPRETGVDPIAASFRHSYCATCKTLGVYYGQKARILLNHDLVFLSELFKYLTHSEQNNSIKPYKCLDLPTKSQVPLYLQYTSTISLVLANLKLEDKVTDENLLWAKLSNKIYSPAFQKAAEQLRSWGFPYEKLQTLTKHQKELESTSRGVNSIPEVLDHYSELTALATSLCVREGGRILQCDVDSSSQLQQLGYAYGRLIYFIDSVEDQTSDQKKNQFNPLLSLSLDKHNPKTSKELLTYALGLKEDILQAIYALPIQDSVVKSFASSFINSFWQFQKEHLTPTPNILVPLSWKDRVNLARQKSAIASLELRCQPTKRRVNWFTQGLITSTIFIIALLRPDAPINTYHEAGLWDCASDVWGCICLIIGLGVLANICCGNKN